MDPAPKVDRLPVILYRNMGLCADWVLTGHSDVATGVRLKDRKCLNTYRILMPKRKNENVSTAAHAFGIQMARFGFQYDKRTKIFRHPLFQEKMDPSKITTSPPAKAQNEKWTSHEISEPPALEEPSPAPYVIVPPAAAEATAAVSNPLSDIVDPAIELTLAARWLIATIVSLISAAREVIGAERGDVFSDAVDIVKYQIPDYHQIIEKPMHLRMVADKIRAGEYTYSFEAARDVSLVFENCMVFNGPVHPFYEVARDLRMRFWREYMAFSETGGDSAAMRS